MLLHLLSNIADLPVTKSLVKGSGMGKVIGTIDKHKICAGTPNESAIKDRIVRIKDSWNASVKALKSQDSNGGTKTSKRALDSQGGSPTAAKRSKTLDDSKKGTSFTSLIKKVSSSVRSRSAPAEDD